jgi:hypothetical protein
MSRLLFVANLIHDLRCDQSGSFSSRQDRDTIAFARSTNARSQGAPNQVGNDAPSRGAPPCCEFLGRLEHVLVDIQSGPRRHDRHASSISCQTPFGGSENEGAARVTGKDSGELFFGIEALG